MENKINFSPPSTREGKGVRFLLTTFSILLCSLQAVAQSLPRVAPEQVGMDSHRLLHADEAIHQSITKKYREPYSLSSVMAKWLISRLMATNESIPM